MLCPSCRAGCAEEDIFCRRCGADLSVPSKSLVPVQSQLPTLLTQSPLPRVAAGVGAVAVGVGLELLRRGLLARLAGRRAAKLLPTLAPNNLLDLLPNGQLQKPAKLPRGYVVNETVIYMSRVIRRED